MIYIVCPIINYCLNGNSSITMCYSFDLRCLTTPPPPPPHPHSLLKTPQKRLKVFDSPPHIIILKSHHIPFKNQKNIRN